MKKGLVVVLMSLLCLFVGAKADAACTGTFIDVGPAMGAFCDLIEKFADYGITAGCAADNPATPGNEAMYCPNDPVTRGQMAVFLTTVLDHKAQKKLTGGACSSSQAVRSIDPATGVITCGSVATGDITAVNTAAGSGLTGGAASGVVNLNVNWGGTGAATTVARSDHGHNSAYLQLSGGTLAGDVDLNAFLRFGDYSINQDDTDFLVFRGPQHPAFGPPPLTYDTISFGGYNYCPSFPCLLTTTDTIDIRLGNENSDRVTFGTGDVRYANPKTRHWSISGADFLSYDGGAVTFTKSNYALYSTTARFSSPVHLPDGAIITKMTVRYLDNDAGDDFNVTLYRTTLDESDSIMASFWTTGADPAYGIGENTAISDAMIDNSQYSYSLFLWSMNGATTHRLGGVVLEYTVTEPLP